MKFFKLLWVTNVPENIRVINTSRGWGILCRHLLFMWLCVGVIKWYVCMYVCIMHVGSRESASAVAEELCG